MKWRTRPDPKHGETRTRREFAWTPRKCHDGYTVWLRFVYVEEKYRDYGTMWRQCVEAQLPPPIGFMWEPWATLSVRSTTAARAGEGR